MRRDRRAVLSDAPAMNIELHIERLILDSLPIERSQAPHIQAAVESELTRLLTENGLAASLQGGGAVSSVQANAIQLAPGSSPAQMGAQIAQSVYGSIGSVR
jgi:hypothetical protein